MIPTAIVPPPDSHDLAPASDLLVIVALFAVEVDWIEVVVAVDVFGGGVVIGKV